MFVLEHGHPHSPMTQTMMTTLPELAAKLRKKLVTNNGFWKINAIRPKIRAKRGRMRMYENEGNAKFGGLVRELGFLFVTRFLFRKLLHFASDG